MTLDALLDRVLGFLVNPVVEGPYTRGPRLLQCPYCRLERPSWAEVQTCIESHYQAGWRRPR